MTDLLNPRWADADETVIRAETPDGAALSIPADPANRLYAELIEDGVAIAPFRRWADIAEAKAALVADIDARAAALRTAVAGTSEAAKFALYREKYALAVAALGGDASALSAFDAEAGARAMTAHDLAQLVKTMGDAWRSAGLAIDAAAAAHKAAIAALADVAAAEAYDVGAGW